MWTTRIGNIWGDDDLTDGEKWGRTGAGAELHRAGRRGRSSRCSAARPWRGLAVRALAGWTIAVWVVRAVGIATGDHEAAFIAVHLVLAVVSITLAVLAVREQRARPLELLLGTASTRARADGAGLRRVARGVRQGRLAPAPAAPGGHRAARRHARRIVARADPVRDASAPGRATTCSA